MPRAVTWCNSAASASTNWIQKASAAPARPRSGARRAEEELRPRLAGEYAGRYVPVEPGVPGERRFLPQDVAAVESGQDGCRRLLPKTFLEVARRGRDHVLALRLNRLNPRHAKELVAAAISGEALPGELVDRLATRSDGIPFFVEELAKGAVEAGLGQAGPLAGLEIPETLQDSLMARLDRLGDAKQVAQLGSAIGREFPFALLKAVAPLKEVALREGLGRLAEAELLHQRGLPPKAVYTFKHALLQDTAYESLLESQRQEIHGRDWRQP